MAEVRGTEAFSDWLDRLSDARAFAKIVVRLERVAAGNFGDVEPVGEGVSELRIHHGPGYRIYFTRVGTAVVVLLCGGDKSSQDGTSGPRNLWQEGCSIGDRNQAF